jgi:GNAT superfamily N-acetyltransferase
MSTNTTHPAGVATAPLDRPVEERVTLLDGSVAVLRQICPEDEGAMRSFLDGLCLEARRYRFFSGAANIASAAHLTVSTATMQYGLIAVDETGAFVGHGLYVPFDGTRAEVALEVADRLHGRGLGTILVERLAAHAEACGITHFLAEVLSDNRAMLDVFREGFDARVVRHEGPEERVEFLTASWRYAKAMGDRLP